MRSSYYIIALCLLLVCIVMSYARGMGTDVGLSLESNVQTLIEANGLHQ